MQKQLLRRQMFDIRKGYDQSFVKESSQRIFEHIVQWDIFQQSKGLMGYLAYGNEVNVDGILQDALANEKKVAVPFIVDGKNPDNVMQSVEFTGFNDIVVGEYNIRTVRDINKKVNPLDLDLILVPGLAFTTSGERMGLGKGYYDRFLPQARNAVTIGITLSRQLVNQIPIDEHDIKMDFIVTQDGIVDCKNV